MQITFRFFTGRILKIDLEDEETILDAKNKIAQILGVEIEIIRLIHKAKLLTDAQIIGEMKLLNEPPITIHIVHKRNQSNSQNKPESVVDYLIPKQEQNLVNDNNLNILDSITLQKKIENKPLIPFLPPRKGHKLNQKPANYQELVNNLNELGYEHSLCEEALTTAFYNVERAIEYLLNQNIPKNVSYDVEALIKERNDFCAQILNYNKEIHIKSIDNSKNALLLTSQDQISLSHLFALGFEKSLVIQIFEACEKNEEIALYCLNSITI